MTCVIPQRSAPALWATQNDKFVKSTASMEPITIAITNYNGRHVLEDTLRSIRNLDYPDYSVVLVDDGSTDDSIRFVSETFPEVRIIEMGRNTARLNKVRNRGITAAETRLVFL